MALINCDECKAEVSDRAASCPRCGNPIAGVFTQKIRSAPTPGASGAQQGSDIWRYVGYSLVALTAVGAYVYWPAPVPNQTTAARPDKPTTSGVVGGGGHISLGHRVDDAASTDSDPAPTAVPEKNVSIQALPGWPSEQPSNVALDRLIADYDANEVAADNKYKNHLLIVSGPVNEIKKDLEGRTYLNLDVQSHFLGVNATLNPKYVQLAASLVKGNTVSMVCVGDEKIITPQLKNCAIGGINGSAVEQPANN
ncbi:OB-fold protein [Burkholderia gladioli]|uniref:OB-fold protein n=1 Tax=Burkholderia gladioli TaxID=28095 RepID=UPI00163F9C17|nr:hypothetical protein [Burkholderia gladioli]